MNKKIKTIFLLLLSLSMVSRQAPSHAYSYETEKYETRVSENRVIDKFSNFIEELEVILRDLVESISVDDLSSLISLENKDRDQVQGQSLDFENRASPMAKDQYKNMIECFINSIHKLEGLSSYTLDETFTDEDIAILSDILIDELEGSYSKSILKGLKLYSSSTKYGSGKSLSELTLSVDYHHNQDQEEEINSFVQATIEELGLSSPELSTYDKVLMVHDHIIFNTSYAKETEEIDGISIHSPYSIIANKKGVCQSYAGLFQKFMNQLGIESYYVTGKTLVQGQAGESPGQGHAWNKVNIDGNYYNIDLTWDDPIILLNGEYIDRSQSGHENYEYFLKSDEFFVQSRLADQSEKYPLAVESYSQ